MMRVYKNCFIWMEYVTGHFDSLPVAQDVDDSLIVCRVYASIADMLGFMAGEARIRAGPAANVAWHSAFAMLEVSEGCTQDVRG